MKQMQKSTGMFDFMQRCTVYGIQPGQTLALLEVSSPSFGAC